MRIEGPEQAAGPVLRRVLGNSAWLIVAEGGTRIVSLGTLLYLSRTLAPDGMGAVQFGLAVFSFLQLVCTGGAEALLTPEATHRPRELARLAGRSLLLGWATFAVAFGVLVAATWALGMPPAMRWSAVAFGLAAAMAPLALRFAFIGRERARVVGLGTLAGHLAFLGLCVASVHRPEEVGRVALCWMAATALRVASQLATFVREHGGLGFDARGFAAELRRSTLLGTGTVARGLVLNVDVLVLGLLRPADEVARYGLAVKLPLFVVSWSTLFYTALFPTLARAVAVADASRVARIEAATVEAVLGLALPGALCLWLVADPVVVLLFSERFRDAASLLGLLVWRIPLVAAAGIFRTSAWARHPESDARIAVQVLVATVALLLALGSRAGAPGVAAGVLAGDALALALYLHAGGLPALARIRPAALARLAIGVGLAALLMGAAPPHDGPVAVGWALAAWAAGTLVADAPHLGRLAADVAGRRR